MTVSVLAIVLCAAFLHACWNALVKASVDSTITLGLVALGHAIPAFVIALFVAAPDPASYPYIIASTVIHWGYYYFLNISFRHGDLSFAYPIARGVAPVMIALGAVVWADEVLPFWAWVGIATVSAGILFLAGLRRANGTALRSALITSCFIAAYSIADGLGIRASGSPVGYVAWLFALEIIVAGYVFSTRWSRARALPLKGLWLGFAGGIISGVAYGLALYAKTLAPLGVVSALRETSVIFAALIGVVWFGEGPARRRLIAALIVVTGIVILTLA